MTVTFNVNGGDPLADFQAGQRVFFETPLFPLAPLEGQQRSGCLLSPLRSRVSPLFLSHLFSTHPFLPLFGHSLFSFIFVPSFPHFFSSTHTHSLISDKETLPTLFFYPFSSFSFLLLRIADRLGRRKVRVLLFRRRKGAVGSLRARCFLSSRKRLNKLVYVLYGNPFWSALGTLAGWGEAHSVCEGVDGHQTESSVVNETECENDREQTQSESCVQKKDETVMVAQRNGPETSEEKLTAENWKEIKKGKTEQNEEKNVQKENIEKRGGNEKIEKETTVEENEREKSEEVNKKEKNEEESEKEKNEEKNEKEKNEEENDQENKKEKGLQKEKKRASNHLEEVEKEKETCETQEEKEEDEKKFFFEEVADHLRQKEVLEKKARLARIRRYEAEDVLFFAKLKEKATDEEIDQKKDSRKDAEKENEACQEEQQSFQHAKPVSESFLDTDLSVTTSFGEIVHERDGDHEEEEKKLEHETRPLPPPELLAFGDIELWRVFDKRGDVEYISYPGVLGPDGLGPRSFKRCCSCVSGSCSSCACARKNKVCVDCEASKFGRCSRFSGGLGVRGSNLNACSNTSITSTCPSSWSGRNTENVLEKKEESGEKKKIDQEKEKKVKETEKEKAEKEDDHVIDQEEQISIKLDSLKVNKNEEMEERNKEKKDEREKKKPFKKLNEKEKIEEKLQEKQKEKQSEKRKESKQENETEKEAGKKNDKFKGKKKENEEKVAYGKENLKGKDRERQEKEAIGKEKKQVFDGKVNKSKEKCKEKAKELNVDPEDENNNESKEVENEKEKEKVKRSSLHEATETEREKNFRCQQCGRVFETKRGLAQHSRIHSQRDDLEEQIPLEHGVDKWERLFSAQAATLKHIPSSLRNPVMEVLSSLLSSVSERPEAETRWWLLFAFPKLCLRVRERGGKKEKHREVSDVATRLKKAKEHRWAELWEELTIEEARRKKKSYSNQREQEKGGAKKLRKRVIELVEEGRYAKACRALEDVGLHNLTPQVVDELASKHPQVDPASVTEAPRRSGFVDGSWVVDKETVKKALLAFPRGTGAGASGWRAEHLKEALRAPLGEEGGRILVPLTKVVNVLLAGKVPKEIAPWIAGAPLYPLNKKDGGVRPIAVGEILRRLVSRTICLSPDFEDLCKDLFLEGNQVGVGVKGGAEAVVHATRYWFQNNDGHVVLKLDFVNAFNNVSRKVIRGEVTEKCPKLLPWLDFCYGEAAILRCEGVPLPFRSRVGVQQGDPLGPFLFALALNSLVRDLKSRLHVGKAFWYLDDGIVVGPKDDVAAAWLFLKEKGKKIGLVLNEAKCELFAQKPEDMDGIPGDMKRQVGGGFDILGSPVGDGSFCEDYVSKRVEKIKIGIHRLRLVDDPQIEATLIRSCLGMPKFAFALRSAPFVQIRGVVAAFDEVIEEALKTRLGLDVGEDEMEQARLPVGKGGLGFVRGEDVACSAFVASSFDSVSIMEGLLGRCVQPESIPGLPATYEILKGKCDADADLPACVGDAWKGDLKKMRQKELTGCIMEKKARDWIGRAPTRRELVRRKAVMRKDPQLGAVGNWMNIVPAKWAGSKLEPVEFVKAIRWWLGVSVCQKGAHPCAEVDVAHQDEADEDSLGDHAVMDPKGPYRIARHDRVNKTWCALLRRAGYEAELEKGVEVERKTRVADTWVEEWQDGKAAAHDWVIGHALQKDVIEGKVAHVETLLKGAEHKKMAKEQEVCDSRGLSFVPLAMDTLCGFGDQARSAIIQVAMQSRLRCRDLSASMVAGSLRVAMLKGLSRQLLAHDQWEEEEEEVFLED